MASGAPALIAFIELSTLNKSVLSIVIPAAISL
jgi:hypothetical protein